MTEKPWTAHYDPGVPRVLDYRPIPLFTFLEEAARSDPDQLVTIYKDRAIRYAELNAASNALAAALVDLGVRKGDRVGLLIPNLPQFVISFYAVLKAGGVVVAMNPAYKQRELAYQIQDLGAGVLIALSSFKPVLESIRTETGLRRLIYSEIEDAFQIPVAADPVLALPPAGDLVWLDLLRRFAGQPRPPVEVTPEDEAIFQYSGGTTGIPKGAIGLHRNLVANTMQFRAWLSGLVEGKEVVLASIPLFHVYGMVIAMSMGVALGASLVLIDDPRDTGEILRSIQHYRATLFPGVPNSYHAINQHPDVQAGKYDLRSIKACISGSAPLLQEIKQRFEALTGGKLLEGYGLSEAPTATHCNPMFGENRSGSIGLPLPDVDARIVDLETGAQDMPPGEPGELVVRGPQVMEAYHNRPAETEIALRDGWLYTGDIARMDPEGYFYLIDRKKEVIKVGGFQVWPREVEEVIAAHPKVLEVGVAGVPHPSRVEIVKAWVVPHPGQTLTEQEVQDWCEQNLASFKVPYRVEFRDVPLPRTLVGKLLRRELVAEEANKRSPG